MTEIPSEIYPDWLSNAFLEDTNPYWRKNVDRMSDTEAGKSHLRYDDPETKPHLVYHYTSAVGLQGIISSHSLYASDVAFLNDSRELTYAAENLLHALRQEREVMALRSHEVAGNLPKHPEIVRELGIRDNRRKTWGRHLKAEGEPNSLGALDALSSIIRELEQMCGPSRSSPLHVYVSCFCESGDLLSQWRGYGGVGGYAVGFRSDTLEKRAKVFPMAEFENVRYGFNESVTGASGLFPGYLSSETTLMRDYLKPLTMIKNDAFEEEQEWRVMIPRDHIDEITKFRVGPVGVTPYLTVDFRPEDVGEVVVGPGPHSEERVNGTHQLLERYNMKHARVVLSETSLRL